jgi:crotonobetaine/carnitine-CoA ligase
MQMFLWNEPPRPDDRDNPARRAYMTPLPSTLVEPFKERFGLEDTLQSSGQSEVMGWSFCDSRKPAWKPGSAGLPREDLEVVLFDEFDQPVPTGTVGEICVRPSVPYSLFAGYYNDPETTLTAFRNLWYHSGDLGRFDEDGELYFVDRKADFMRYKGRNISSMEVESYVIQHPSVREVAAHGVRSEELETEDEVKVCIVLKPGMEATGIEIARFVNERAPYFMVPRYIEFCSELPHTPTGKVQKFLLREKPVSETTWDAKAAGFTPVRD